MKFFLMLSCILIFLGFNTYANSCDNKPLTLKNNSKFILHITLLESIYFFQLMNDGCFHLVRMNPPGYIDGATGQYFETWSMTVMTNNNYTGTVMICPPEGIAYC